MNKTLVKQFEELTVSDKMHYATKYDRYLTENIEKYIAMENLDDLYLDLKKDNDIQEILKENSSIRWEEFSYLGEMIALGSDGGDDYEYFTDESFLSDLLFEICKQNAHWFNRIIHNKINDGKYILSNVGLYEDDLLDYFNVFKIKV